MLTLAIDQKVHHITRPCRLLSAKRAAPRGGKRAPKDTSRDLINQREREGDLSIAGMYIQVARQSVGSYRTVPTQPLAAHPSATARACVYAINHKPLQSNIILRPMANHRMFRILTCGTARSATYSVAYSSIHQDGPTCGSLCETDCG